MTWPDVPHVTVPGNGSATGPPDAVGVTLTATGRGDNPADALQACGRTQGAALRALADAGASDVQSTAITVHDEWEHEHNRPGRPQAQSELAAVLPDVTAAGDAMVGVLRAAPDVRLQALTPQLRDPDALLRQARETAFVDARVRAEQHAALAGATLGPLLQLVEGGLPYGVGHARGRRSQKQSAGFEIPAGVTSLSVTVEATWALVHPTD